MIVIRGGGLAGASAAIAACRHSPDVLIVEKSRFPRHKVCGEFLSSEAIPLLDRMGIALPEAARIRRVLLRFACNEKWFTLPEPALGISRYLLDQRLFESARSHGAKIATTGPQPQIVAHGRKSSSPKGNRLFGFKTHFRGPSSDSVEMYFFDGGYVGVSAVEEGITNVCGLMSEDRLVRINFHPDELILKFQPLAERLARFSKLFDWLMVGPLIYENKVGSADDHYLAGDALSFIDPFTGSGMIGAVATGYRAGEAAALREPPAKYYNDCRRILGQPYEISTLFRKALNSQWSDRLLPFIPGKLLYSLTRPRVRT